MAVATELIKLIGTTVEGMGYELVDVEWQPRGKMVVTIDKEGGVDVDDCEKVSNQLVSVFAVENVDFDRLEVSSPGVDRPLRRPKDFVRFVGQTAHVELYVPMKAEGLPENGRRRMDGKILSAEGDDNNPVIRLELLEERPARTPAERFKARKKQAAEQKPAVILDIPFKDIEKASLVADLDFRGANKNE